MRTPVFLRRAIVAALASLAGGVAALAVVVGRDLLAGDITPPLPGLVLLVLIFFTFPIAIALTIIDRLLVGLKRTSAIAYGVVTVAASISIGFLAMLITHSDALYSLPGTWVDLIRPLVPFAANGAIAGITFWMLRRRAGIETSNWSDVF